MSTLWQFKISSTHSGQQSSTLDIITASQIQILNLKSSYSLCGVMHVLSMGFHQICKVPSTSQNNANRWIIQIIASQLGMGVYMLLCNGLVSHPGCILNSHLVFPG